MELIHGGDVAGFLEEYGVKPLDFSANINPLGMPEGARQAVIQALEQADQYPDPLCRELRRAIAAREGVPAEWIRCGGGAAGLIFRLVFALRPRRALVTVPTFAEYEQALEAAGCQVCRWRLKPEEGFRLTEEYLEALTPDLDVAFVCNPNNPTGQTVAPDLLARIGEKCRQNHIVLAADECFNQFLDRPEEHTLKSRLAEWPNLLLFKAFTKFYAMAGLRLGYCLCADGALLDNMDRMGQPWEVSGLAQAAGLAALEDLEYEQKSRALIREQRLWLRQALQQEGFDVIGGEANYLFFRSNSPRLAAKTRRLGAMIRDCGNYPGLEAGGYYRIAVRGPEENRRLIQILAQARRP